MKWISEFKEELAKQQKGFNPMQKAFGKYYFGVVIPVALIALALV